MKKLLLLFILTISLAASAQTIPAYPTIKLTKPTLGTKNDSIIVRNDATGGVLKILPVSQIKGTTNLDFLATPTGGTIFSSTGNDATLSLSTTINAGLQSPADKSKLDGIATGATANQTDAYLLNRVNHTGVQEISTVTGLQVALDTKVDKVVGERLINAAEITKLSNQSGINTGDQDLSNLVVKNIAIVAGTNTKITYDSKGLVTAGSSLVASDVPILNQNTTGTASAITGSITESQVVNLVSDLAAKQTTLVSGSNIKTIETQSILGVGNIDFTQTDVGLANVDNTSDLLKPISTATQTSLDIKVDKLTGKSLILDTEITRLATLANYTHPTNHPPSIITQDVSNRFVTDVEKSTWNAKQSALGYTAENVANKNVASGYAGLGADGKLISSQLPSITISDTYVVASQAEMLGSTLADKGDVAVRTDLNKSFILKGNLYSTLADWQELLTPTSAVTTVFGRNGTVTAQTGDYTADQISETASIVFQTPTQRMNNDATSSIQTQLNGKQVSGSYETAFSKNTAFNKNFGTVAGTVVEGGTLGSNAYNSTAYLPLTGGTLTGALTGTTATFSSTVTAPTFTGALNGNASTANNATTWNGLAYSGIYTTFPTSMLGLHANGSTYQFSLTDTRNWLGLGSNAYNSTAYLPLTGGTLSSAYGTSLPALTIYNNSATNVSNVSLLDFRANNSFGGNERIASISASNPNATSNNGGQLNFLVSANGTGTVPTVALTIAQDKSVTLSGSLTGTTANFSSSVTGDGFVVSASDSRLKGGSSSGRFIASNSTTTSYIEISGATSANPDELSLITSTGKVGIFTNGTKKVTVENNGNVGIGTITPSEILTVGNPGANNQFLRINNTSGTPNQVMGGIKFFNTISTGFEIGRIEYGLGTTNVNDGTLKFYVGNSGAFSPALSLFQTGAATFSSSVTATAHVTTGGTASQFVKGDGSLDNKVYAPLDSPMLTGIPIAPTATAPTNSQQLATTAFVQNAVVNYSPLTQPVPADYTASFTATIGMRGYLLIYNSTTAGTITIPDIGAIGDRFDFMRKGTGSLTIGSAAGIALVSSNGFVARAQYSVISAIKISTTEWLITGDTIL